MYSPQARAQFIKSKVCQDDPVLVKYYEAGDAQKFRKRLGKTDVSDAVHTLITDATRDIILSTVKVLSRYMRPMGDLIISGGEAFNMYLPKEDRVITTDIDTKFAPFFRTGQEAFISSRDPRFFEALQITKLLLWDKIGQLSLKLNSHIAKRIQQVSETPLGKLLGIQAVKGQAITRRYTLIAKKKQGTTSVVKEGDVLIDVELFALDLKVRYLGQVHNLGGLLDMAFMRPSEVGYEVMYNRQTVKKGLLVASKKFLIEDLYMLQSLKLRPKKAAKDRLRMYTFATKVLKVDVSPGDSMKTIFFKCLPKIRNEGSTIPRRPIFDYKKLLQKAIRVNATKYLSTLSRKPLPCASAKGTPTRSQYAFDIHSKKWVSVTSSMYIRNMANYRGGTSCLKKTLYGYNPERNAAMPKWLVNKASKIG